MTADADRRAPDRRRHGAATHAAPARGAAPRGHQVLVAAGRCSRWRSSSRSSSHRTTMPFTSLMVPLLLGSLLLGPRHLPWFVVFMLRAADRLPDQQDEPDGRTLRRGRRSRSLMCADRAGRLAAPRPASASRARRASRCSSTCATGSAARAASRTCPPGWHAESALRSAGGTPFAGDFVVATRRRRRPARGGRGRRLRQGRGGRHPRAAALRRLRRPARRAAADAVPPCRQRLPAPPGLGGGLRDRRSTSPSTSRPATTRSARPATRRPRCGRPARAGGACCQRGADARADRRTPTSPRPRARLRRGDALLLYTDGMVEEPRRDIDLGIDRMLGRGRAAAARRASTAPRGGWSTRSARATTTARWWSFTALTLTASRAAPRFGSERPLWHDVPMRACARM